MAHCEDPQNVPTPESEHCGNCEHYTPFRKYYEDGFGGEDWDECGMGPCNAMMAGGTTNEDAHCEKWMWNGY